MAYSLSEVRAFYEKDVKYNIGMGVGNAFNKAVDVVIARVNELDEGEDIIKRIMQYRDTFFQENQNKIEQEIEMYLNMHPIQEWYEEQKAKDEEIKEAQENIIDIGEKL